MVAFNTEDLKVTTLEFDMDTKRMGIQKEPFEAFKASQLNEPHPSPTS